LAGLCPGTKITGGKVMSGKTKRCANRAAQALRLAATTLRSSQSALGTYFRHLCARMDKPKAVTVAAHKLARLIYLMLTKGEEYTDQGQDYYEERYRQRVLRHLAQRAKKMGMKLVSSDPPMSQSFESITWEVFVERRRLKNCHSNSQYQFQAALALPRLAW
jgi:transposase